MLLLAHQDRAPIILGKSTPSFLARFGTKQLLPSLAEAHKHEVGNTFMTFTNVP